MTPSLRRFWANRPRFAVASLVATLLISLPTYAQTTSAKAHTAPAAKGHAMVKTVRATTPWVPNPGVGSKDSYLIVDAASGREIASDQPDELRHPASLTKLMTLYLTFSALDSGRLSLGDGLAVSAAALNAPPTKMGMTPNGSMLVRHAVMGLVTRSANDAAVLLADALGAD